MDLNSEPDPEPSAVSGPSIIGGEAGAERGSGGIPRGTIPGTGGTVAAEGAGGLC